MIRIILGILSVIAAFLAILWPFALNRLNVSTRSITISLSEGVGFTLVASLSHKTFGFGDFAYVGGTITASLRQSVFSVSPLVNTTTTAAPDAMFTITPLSVGTGTFSVSGTSTQGNHGSHVIKVTVIP